MNVITLNNVYCKSDGSKDAYLISLHRHMDINTWLCRSVHWVYRLRLDVVFNLLIKKSVQCHVIAVKDGL